MDRKVPTASDQTITCAISGLSQTTAITWVGPDENDIENTDTTNYVINDGSYDSGSVSPTLTIKKVKLDALSTDSVFKCKLTSALYSDSEVSISQMTLTKLTLGKTKILTL